MEGSRSASPATVGEAELLRSVSTTRNSPSENSQKLDATKKSKKKKIFKNADHATDFIISEAGLENKTKRSITQQYVDHTYTDYAIVEEDDLRLLDENSSLLPNPASSGEASAREKLRGMSCTYGPMKKNAGGVVQPFPGKVSGLSHRHLVPVFSCSLPLQLLVFSQRPSPQNGYLFVSAAP